MTTTTRSARTQGATTRSAQTRSAQTDRRAAGFTLLEVLITLAVLGVVLTLSVPGLLALRERRALQGNGEQVKAFLQRARYQAIDRNVSQQVAADLSAGLLFIDADEDGALDAAERSNGVYQIANTVRFGGPAADADAVTGFTTVSGRTVALFRPDGSLADPGAIRLRDVEGDDFLEVRVIAPATGLARLRKWDGSTWKENGEGGESWSWN